MSFNQVLQKVCWLFNVEKVGYIGSFDLLVIGVLLLCFGEVIKFFQYFFDVDKGYEMVMCMGIIIIIGDVEGELFVEWDVIVGWDDFEQVLLCFCGDIEQVLLMYLVLKKDGQLLYKFVCVGEVVECEVCFVIIMCLDLFFFELFCVILVVFCSKGIYVCMLVEDFGQVLGCGVYVVVLWWIQVGLFVLVQVIIFEMFECVYVEGGLEVLD